MTNTDDTRSKLQPFLDAAATMNRIPAQPESRKDAVLKASQNIKIPIMSPKMQEAIANLSKISIPPIPKMPELPEGPTFEEIGDMLGDSIAKHEQFKREAQAQAMADAMNDVIKEILKEQNDINASNRKKDHRTLWRIAFVTILGAGLTSFFGNWLFAIISR